MKKSEEDKKKYGVIKQKLNHLTKEEYKYIYDMSHICKNIYNVALYENNKYFKEHKDEENKKDRYPKKLETLVRPNENYKLMNSVFSRGPIDRVQASFISFSKVLKKKNNGEYSARTNIPQYLEKDAITTISSRDIKNLINIKDGYFRLPLSKGFREINNIPLKKGRNNEGDIKIKLPKIITDKKVDVKVIQIVPKNNGKFFECHYIYEKKDIINNKPDKTKALAIDLGIDNFCTCVTNEGKSFIIDGKSLKSINQYYNKTIAKLSSIKDKQNEVKGYTNRMNNITVKRNSRIDYYIHKSARIIIDYCINNNIGNLVIGYNKDFQRNSNIGKKNNQKFVNIPYGKLLKNLEYLCKDYNIIYTETEESYTSKASFFDNDEIPIYKENDKDNYSFSGKRIKRGLYKNSMNYTYNADVNGALNIMKKSKVVPLDGLYCNGVVDTPVRIRIS